MAFETCRSQSLSRILLFREAPAPRNLLFAGTQEKADFSLRFEMTRGLGVSLE
jgi:hypothetical protein